MSLKIFMKTFIASVILSAFILSSCGTCTQSAKVYFAPPGFVIEDAIVEQIDSAHKQILVEAYGFTSEKIVDALLRAQNRHFNTDTVEVEALLDRSNETASYSKWKLLRKAHIPVKIDDEGHIAHNKIMIIDSNVIITGSFNFTENAKHNEENVLIITDHNLAMQYIDNWNTREGFSRPPKRIKK
jgi:phospholipase D